MRTSIPQIFEEVEKQTNKQDKIKVLRSYDNQILRAVLEINFLESYVLHLPEGAPPYKRVEQTPDGYSETNLYTEFRRIYIWLDPSSTLSKTRKEQLWIQMLEGLHWKEADLMNKVKDKKLTDLYKSVTYDLVYEAFPGMLPLKEKAKPAKKETKKDPLVH